NFGRGRRERLIDPATLVGFIESHAEEYKLGGAVRRVQLKGLPGKAQPVVLFGLADGTRLGAQLLAVPVPDDYFRSALFWLEAARGQCVGEGGVVPIVALRFLCQGGLGQRQLPPVNGEQVGDGRGGSAPDDWCLFISRREIPQIRHGPRFGALA